MKNLSRIHQCNKKVSIGGIRTFINQHEFRQRGNLKKNKKRMEVGFSLPQDRWSTREHS